MAKYSKKAQDKIEEVMREFSEIFKVYQTRINFN